MCGVGDKECAICCLGEGCLASMREDFFVLASERQIVERLNKSKYSKYRQLMVDTLKKEYNHEYIGYEELPPLPKEECCCDNVKVSKHTDLNILERLTELSRIDSELASMLLSHISPDCILKCMQEISERCVKNDA